MRHTGVTNEQLDAECDDLHLDELSEHIVDYRRYGPRLDLTEADIQNIERNPVLFFSQKLKVAAVFKKWHSKNGCEATYRRLLKVALKLEDGSGAEKICQICAEGS